MGSRLKLSAELADPIQTSVLSVLSVVNNPIYPRPRYPYISSTIRKAFAFDITPSSIWFMT